MGGVVITKKNSTLMVVEKVFLRFLRLWKLQKGLLNGAAINSHNHYMYTMFFKIIEVMDGGFVLMEDILSSLVIMRIVNLKPI